MLPIIFDEMYEGKSDDLRKLGYRALSVRELQGMGFHVKHDYSIIKYAEMHRMILITRDEEVYLGCTENQIPCVQLGENPTIDEIIEKIKKFENLV